MTNRRNLLWLAAGFLLVAALACGGAKQTTVPSPVPEASSSAAAATPAGVPSAATPTPRPAKPLPEGARPFPPDLKAEGDKILARVGELRGTPPKADVRMYLVGRREAINYYRDSMTAMDREESALQGDVYKLLGLIPYDTDITETLLSLLGLGIYGFYDPEQSSFFLVDDLGGLDSPASRTTIVHELAHALQDQYYDIKKLRKDLSEANDWDGLTALTDLLEGDAVTTEGVYRNASSQRAPCFQIPAVINLPGLPFVLQRELRTWYEDGYCFVNALAPQLKDTATFFQRLPSTTEQILHPDKYKANEPAKPESPLMLDQLAQQGWQEAARGDLGEFTMQNLLVLGLRNDRPKAQRGAEGWGGDAWELYSKGEARLIQLATVWDSADEAQQFFDSLNESLSGRSAGRQPAVSPNVLAFQVDCYFWRIGLSDDRVTIISSNDSQATETAAQLLNLR